MRLPAGTYTAATVLDCKHYATIDGSKGAAATAGQLHSQPGGSTVNRVVAGAQPSWSIGWMPCITW